MYARAKGFMHHLQQFADLEWRTGNRVGVNEIRDSQEAPLAEYNYPVPSHHFPFLLSNSYNNQSNSQVVNKKKLIEERIEPLQESQPVAHAYFNH